MFTCYLECEDSIEWKESPLTPGADLPFVGRVVYCPKHGDQEVTEVSPRTVTVEVVQLTQDKPHSGTTPYGGYTVGSEAAIFYDAETGTWGWCFQGVGDGGNWSESDDVTGFPSAQEAKEDALGNWQALLAAELYEQDLLYHDR